MASSLEQSIFTDIHINCEKPKWPVRWPSSVSLLLDRSWLDTRNLLMCVAAQHCLGQIAFDTCFDLAVKNRGCSCGLTRDKPMKEIGAANDSHEAAIAEHRHTFDAVLLQCLGDLFERRIFRYGNNPVGHHVAGTSAMGLDVRACFLIGQQQKRQPPGPPVLCLRLRAAHQVTLAYDAKHSTIW